VSKAFGFILILLWFGAKALAQDNDTLVLHQVQKGRVIGVSSGLLVGTSSSLLALGTVWYEDLGSQGFKFRDDFDHWMQMDKWGHAYSGYFINEQVYRLYRWSGVSREKSLLIGSAVSFGYLATFEVLDGFSSDWGFSWSDVAANTLGVGLFAVQEHFWNEQRIRLKFGPGLSPYAQYRPQVLGSTIPERLLKDYNGQTYWLSFNPKSIISMDFWPNWLNLAVGYSIDERLYGSESSASVISGNSTLTFDSYRQYLISLDIDLSKISVKNKVLSGTLKTLNSLKVPFPSLILSQRGISGRIY
jgi:hypothetical protein